MFGQEKSCRFLRLRDLAAGCELREGYRSALFTACQPTIWCSKDGKNAVALSVSHTPSRCCTNKYSVYPFELVIHSSLMEISNYQPAFIISYLAFCLEEFVYLLLLYSALFSVFVFTEIKQQQQQNPPLEWQTQRRPVVAQWSVYHLKSNIFFSL